MGGLKKRYVEGTDKVFPLFKSCLSAWNGADENLVSSILQFIPSPAPLHVRYFVLRKGE